MSESHKYDTIRVCEPDLFDYKPWPMVQFTRPSMISRIRWAKVNRTIGLKDFTLYNVLFTGGNEELYRKWKVLSIRNCHYPKERVQKALENKHGGNATVKNQYM